MKNQAQDAANKAVVSAYQAKEDIKKLKDASKEEIRGLDWITINNELNELERKQNEIASRLGLILMAVRGK